MNIRTIDFSNININLVREEVMKRADKAKTQLEKAVKKAQKDVNQYQQQIETKIKDLSKIGKTQVDEAITFVKAQPITNTILEKAEPLIAKVEPLKNDLKSKEKVIKGIVGTILKRAKDVRQTLRDPISQVQNFRQNLKNRVLKTTKATPVKKAKKSTPKAKTTKGTATKKRKTK